MVGKIAFYSVLCCLTLNACGQNNPRPNEPTRHDQDGKGTVQRFNPHAKTIGARFMVPQGYERVTVDSTSFAHYLRQLPLKEDGALVTYFDGRSKPNPNIYDAVVDLPIGNRDLHQCADAVIRLRADYLFRFRKYDSIHFNFTNGFKADYPSWQKGKRIVVNGHNVYWKPALSSPTGPVTGPAAERDFWKYLEMVFSYAGTASLSKELKSVSLAEMRIGDIFIKGGFPGHAVIVVDMALKKGTGDKLFLLAQSYMPAQEIQVLKNPNDADLSPWYPVSGIHNELHTPEWKFTKNQLKRF